MDEGEGLIEGKGPPAEAERRRTIAALAARQPPSQFVPYRGGYLKAPVIELPHDLLVYRVENGRLIAELAEHARAHGEDLASLGARQDSAAVQRLLHDFLAAKARDPRGPVLQELERVAQQTEPLLITEDGVLVNGNRRLAAMRALMRRDPARYAGFASVAAAVLPADADLADIESVEAALQLAPDTKLAYGWINRRLKMRRQCDELGLPVETIVASYRLAGPEQLELEIAELALAEDYLATFCGAPGRYSLVDDAELLFVGLHARLAVLPASLQRLWRLAGFAMIHGRAAIAGPFDRQFPFAPPAPEHIAVWAMRRFAEERGLLAEGDPDAAGSLDRATRQNLETVLADPARSQEIAPALSVLMERLRSEHQDLASPLRMMRLIEKLRQTMNAVQPDRLDKTQKRRLRVEIAAIEAQAAILLGDRERGRRRPRRPARPAAGPPLSGVQASSSMSQ
ncbi:MAG: hypothetical protein WDM92_13385 [Caulobacteraceae bacterium]